MRIKNTSQIKIGMVVYYAMCIGNGFVDNKKEIISLPFKHKSLYLINSLFVEYKDKYGKDIMSLQDCNVQKNNYNKHRLYTSESEAQAYLNYMKRRGFMPAYDQYDYVDYDF